MRVALSFKRSEIPYGWQGPAAVVNHDGGATLRAKSVFHQALETVLLTCS